MTKKEPDWVEIGKRRYYFLHKICDYLELDISDTNEFLANNGDLDWVKTSKGEFLTDSMGFRLLMIDKDKDKYSYKIDEMEFIYKEDRLQEEKMEIMDKVEKITEEIIEIEGEKRENDSKLQTLYEQWEEIEEKHLDRLRKLD